jgi:hypothetical protein
MGTPGGIGGPLGVFFQRNSMSVSLNRGEMWISSLVWLCLGGPGRPDRPWRRWRSMGVTCELPQPPRGLVGPWGCFLNETACRFPCRFHLIEPKFAWGVFSCRARSRPNQANLSMMGVVCTLITHRPTITGDPGLKKVIFSMPHRLIDWCPYRA